MALVIVGTTLLVAHSPADRDLTLTAKVEEGQVSKMLTAKGVISAAKTADLSFKAANYIHSVDVKIGDKVKKGQKVGEEDNGSLRRAVLQSQQALAQSQAALNLILNDYTVQANYNIWQRAKRVADQARKNIELKHSGDLWVARRSEHQLRLDEATEDQAKQQLRTDGCNPDGTPTPPVIPLDPRIAQCTKDLGAVQAADKARFGDVTTLVNNYKNLKINRGGLRSTYRTARQAAVAAFNAYNIARINRPNQIAAAQAAVANALVNVGNANGSLENSYVYAPIDGTVSAIAGTVGEFNAGGSNLSPNTPVAPGGVAKIPTVGDLAGNDQKSLTGGQGPNLGLQAVLPGGNTFMQLSDISAFSAVAAFAQGDAAQIHSGDSAKMTLDSLSGKVIDGKVAAVAPIGTPGPNGVPMYYATLVLNKDQVPDGLISGLTGNVSVVTSTITPKAMVVPTSAVTEDDGQSFVDVPGADGTPQKKAFTKGKVGDDNTEVLSGLNKGDTVLVPSTGPLPPPADNKAPAVPTSDTIVFDETRPGAPAAQQQQSAAAPAPAVMPVPSDTYPGDAGDLDASDTGSISPTGSPGGTTPFAPLAPPPAPANTPGN
ncbi:MAG TPA: HlyD family efflux transporter periplasmic adaptor subunit [Pseudonocardia sp.]